MVNTNLKFDTEELVSFLDYFMCINVLPSCVYVQHVCAWCPRRSEEGVGYPRPGLMDNCEPPCRCWKLNPDPLQEQPVLLITGPSLHGGYNPAEELIILLHKHTHP